MPRRTDISSIIVIGAGFVGICSSSFAWADETSAAGRITQIELNAMSDACHAPRTWLRHRGGDEVRFLPSKRARFDMVDCVLNQLKGSAVPMKFGFVGNMVPSSEDNQK